LNARTQGSSAASITGSGSSGWLSSFGGPTTGIAATTVLLFLVSAIFAPQSLSSGALSGTVPFAAILALVALGQTLVIQQGGIDLSVPGMVSLSAIIVCYYADGGPGGSPNLVPALMFAFTTVALAGLISGILVSKVNVAPIVATLGMNALLYGVSISISGGTPVAIPREISAFVNTRFLGMSLTAYFAVGVAIVLIFVVKATSVGRTFEAVGANERAARAAGISTARYRIAAYVGAAILYAAGGILLGGLMQLPSPQQGDNFLIPSIAAAVLGGTSLFGGRGNLAATVIAAIFLMQLRQLVQTTGASVGVQYLFQGVAILVGLGVYRMNFRNLVRVIRSGGRLGG
jgi:ribose transport system permease protein